VTRPANIALKILMWFGILLATLIVIYALVLAFFDFNRLKDPISRYVTEKTGRELVIGGDLDITWGWPLPRIRVEKVTFANPDWAREDHMFALEKAEIAISLPRLLARKIHLTEVLLAEPTVALELNPDGRKNWLLDREQSDEESSIGIDRLRIDRGRLLFVDPANKTDLTADFTVGPDSEEKQPNKQEEKKEAKGDAPRRDAQEHPSGIRFTVKGRYKATPVAAQGTGGSVLAIRDENIPYPLNVSGKVAGTTIQLDGTVNGLTTLYAVDVKLALKGPSVADLRSVIGVSLPDTKPYVTQGRVIHHDTLWRYEGFTGKIGESDIAGTVSFDGGGEKSVIRGQLNSRVLHIADFGSLVGAQEKKIPPKGEKSADGLLPDTPLPLESWAKLDVDVAVRAGTLAAGKVPVKDLDARLVLKDRVVTVEPLKAGIGGGSIAGTMNLDGRKSPAHAKVDLKIQKVDINGLMPPDKQGKKTDKVTAGRLDGRVALAGTGESVNGILGNADGRLSLVVNGGNVSAFIMEAVGLDLWEMLKFKMQGDKGIEIRCGVVDFGVKKGLMNADAVVLDTSDTKLVVTGDINLGKESLNLTIHPEPKDMSLVSLRTPIHIRGDLSGPKIVPDKTRLTTRGVGALALGIVNPLLALLPLIETGPGLDSDCGKLVAEARQSQAKAPAEAAKNRK
jgi:uncharacterized protein involved in outer membrane biogenesis